MHIKKLIAPILITCFFVIYYVGIGLICYFSCSSILAGCIVAAVGIALSCVMIAMLVERIKEVRSGEEDDLSKY